MWVADLGHEVQDVTGSARVQSLEFVFNASG